MSRDVAAPCDVCGKNPSIKREDGVWIVRCETPNCSCHVYQAQHTERATAVRWWNEELAKAPV